MPITPQGFSKTSMDVIAHMFSYFPMQELNSKYMMLLSPTTTNHVSETPLMVRRFSTTSSNGTNGIQSLCNLSTGTPTVWLSVATFITAFT
jgi:hypothetical protein